MPRPLHDTRVLELATGVAGPYCGKLFADAGADVVKIEPEGGDPLRRRHSGALFEFLNTSKRSAPGADRDRLLTAADLVVTDAPVDAAAGAVVVTISPFGLDGPWAGRAATEFTLQGWCGSTVNRGTVDRPPVAAGARIGEWIGGSYAAAVGLAMLRGAPGARVDLSLLECMSLTLNTYTSVFAEFLGWPPQRPPIRTIEVPGIEPTADGWVGFTTTTAQQFQDFLLLIERPDLIEDDALSLAMIRSGPRYAEMRGYIADWTTKRTTEEIIEAAGLLRIPVAPVHDGDTVTRFEQFVKREVFVPGPSGRFVQPRIPYRLHGVDRPSFRPAPSPGAATDVDWTPREGEPAAAPTALPLTGLRVLDFTAFWAGPAATNVLAALGADVIKLESVQRPDGMRFTTTKRPADHERWWEWGPLFHGVNTNKRSVTLDLTRPDGVELVKRLIGTVDAVIENFSPRVMENFGLDWDAVHAANPNVLMVRIPAYGLTGPWRDRTGFAQNMEQVSGLGSTTGFADGPPMIPRGPCDPLAGLHATFALLAALDRQHRDGEGRLIEVPLVEAALQAVAEAVCEFSATGELLLRNGNRGDGARLQDVYPCAGDETWVAIAAETDEQWRALCDAVGADPTADAVVVETAVAGWCAERSPADVVEALWAVDVPVADCVPPREIHHNEHLRARGFFEVEHHDVTGDTDLPMLPFAVQGVARRWLRTPSPTLGEHTEAVLRDDLGVAADELERLRAARIIGDRLAR